MRSRFWNNQLRLKLIFGTTLLAIIPIIIIGYLSYFVSHQSLHNEIGKAKIETLKQVQSRIDEKLKTLNKTIIQHLYTSELEQFIELNDPMDNISLYQKSIATLASIEALVDNVESATLYVPEKELLLSSSIGIQSTSNLDYTLFARINNNSQSYFWVDDLNHNNTMRDGSKNITYVRAIPITSNKPTGYLIIRIKDQAFIDVYNEMDRSENNEILIATPSGTIFSDWYRSLLKDNTFNYPFINEIVQSEYNEKYYTSVVDSQKMLISYTKSSYNDWTYISVIPVAELSSSFAFIKKFTTFLCFALGIVCISSALLLSRHYYSGIRLILNRIKGKSNTSQPSQAKKGEIEYINDYMDNLQDLNVSLHNQIIKDKPILVSSFIHNVLHEMMSADEIKKQFAHYGLPQVTPFYTVLCLELKFVEDSSDEDNQLLMYAAAKICEEILEEQHCIVNKLSYNLVTIIINHDESNEVNRMKKAFDMAELIASSINNFLKIPASIGIGRCYEISDIRRSFKESREALQYQMVKGVGKIIYIEQVEPISKNHNYSYPYDLEQQIMLFIKLGQLPQVEALLQQFTNTFRENDKINVEQIRISYTQLAYRAQKELYDLDPELASNVIGYSIVEKINACSTMEDIECWIKNHLLLTIANQFQQKRTESSHETMNRVLQYIENHYFEDLSQPLLAEVAELPSSQFGQLFKDKLGVNFSDYLINFRMEKAKKLLLESDMKVSEIANHLRYNNSQNFIRTFKKVTGITPGEYRSKAKL